MTVKRKQSRLLSYRKDQTVLFRPRNYHLQNYPLILPKDSNLDRTSVKSFIPAEDSKWVHLHLAKIYRAKSKSKYSDEEKVAILERSKVTKEKIQKFLDNHHHHQELATSENEKNVEYKDDPGNSVQARSGASSKANNRKNARPQTMKMVSSTELNEQNFEEDDKVPPEISFPPDMGKEKKDNTKRLKKSLTLVRMLGFLNNNNQKNPTNPTTVFPALPSLTRKIGIQERSERDEEQRRQNDRDHHMKMNERLKHYRQMTFINMKNQVMFQEVMDKVQRLDLMPNSNTSPSPQGHRKQFQSQSPRDLNRISSIEHGRSSFSSRLTMGSSVSVNDGDKITPLPESNLQPVTSKTETTGENVSSIQTPKKKRISIFINDPDDEVNAKGDNIPRTEIPGDEAHIFHGLKMSDLIEKKSSNIEAEIDNQQTPMTAISNTISPELLNVKKKRNGPAMPLTMESLLLSTDIKVVEPLRYFKGTFLHDKSHVRRE